mgnify:CR=1 FL=1
MRALRVAILPCFLFLSGGLVTSYGVAWGATYCLDESSVYRSDPTEERASSAQWPIPMRESWLRLNGVREHSEIAPICWTQRPSLGIEIRDFNARLPQFHRSLTELRAGWPARSSRCFTQHIEFFVGEWPWCSTHDSNPWISGVHLLDKTRSYSSTLSLPVPIYFPLRPIWTGLLINSAFYGTMLWALTHGVCSFVGKRRLWSRLCLNCKYPIGISAVCTECGEPVAPPPQVPASGSA